MKWAYAFYSRKGLHYLRWPGTSESAKAEPPAGGPPVGDMVLPGVGVACGGAIMAIGIGLGRKACQSSITLHVLHKASPQTVDSSLAIPSGSLAFNV